ncbi:MAG: hypothetical protein ACK56I_00020, partial [bacterium]
MRALRALRAPADAHRADGVPPGDHRARRTPARLTAARAHEATDRASSSSPVPSSSTALERCGRMKASWKAISSVATGRPLASSAARHASGWDEGSSSSHAPDA